MWWPWRTSSSVASRRWADACTPSSTTTTSRSPRLRPRPTRPWWPTTRSATSFRRAATPATPSSAASWPAIWRRRSWSRRCIAIPERRRRGCAASRLPPPSPDLPAACATSRTLTRESIMDASPPYELVAGSGPRPDGQHGPHSRLELDPAAVADVVTAPSDAVAERARKALWHVLPHTGLVLVSPGSPVFPVQIAAPNDVRRRLAGISWMELVGDQLPVESGVASLELPPVLPGLHLAGWAARTGGLAVA